MARGEQNREERLRYRFEGFTLDVARGTLSKAGEEIYLRPKSFAVLHYLVEHPGILVTRQDLLNAVWHNAAVGDDSITQCVVEIRRILGDAKRKIIRTVPRRGFILESDVRLLEGPRNGTVPDRIEWSQRRLAGVTAILAASLVAVLLWLNSGNESVGGAVAPEPLPNSIAVLAFDDMSESRDQQYFGDGVAEEILTRLSAVPGLNVISRTSSFSMRYEELDIAAIAGRLGVLYVLEGSVRKSGSKMRITAQLIEAGSGTHVWSSNYNLEVTADNVIDVQNDVARNVAEAVGAGTLSTAVAADSPPRTESAEALNHYLQGMYYLRQIETSDGGRYEKALRHFDEAIAADPTWAPPYAASGRVLHFRASRTPKSANSADYEGARKQLLRAVELDPQNSGAYGSLAFVTHTYDLDFEKAELLYKRAMATGEVSGWGYAILLGSIGRVEESIEQYRSGLMKDPLALGMRFQLARMLQCSGRYGESIGHLTRLAEEMPESVVARGILADAYLLNGETEKAQQLLNDLPGLEHKPRLAGPVYAALGLKTPAEDALTAMESSPEWAPEAYARTALSLGQRDRALEYILAAAHSQPQALLKIQCHREIVALANEPHYQKALDLVGFPVRYRRSPADIKGFAARR